MVGHSAVTRYVADGFREDADKILHQFVALQSYEFSDFSHLWREMMFSLVYMGRQSVEELREFTEECFKITLSYLSPMSSTRLKVGAVYLLYGLYFKQPMDTKYKIRILLAQWEEMGALYEFGLKEKHTTLNYVIDKLLDIDAFHFVALPRLMGPLVTLTSEPAYKSDGRLENAKSCMKEFVESNDLNKMSDLFEKYESEKKKLETTKDENLHFVLGNQFSEISDEFEDLLHKKWDAASNASGLCDDVGSRRADLKAKIYKKKTSSDFVKRRDELLNTLSGCEDFDDGNDDTPDTDNVSPVEALTDSELIEKKKKKPKRRRKPKELRKPGRPRKEGNETEVEEKVQTSGKDDSESEGFAGVDYKTFMQQQKPEGRQRRPKPRKTRYHFAGEWDNERKAV